MPIIIISADVGEIEQTIAGKVADQLEYTLLNRQLINEIGTKHHIDPERLNREMETTPSFFKKLSPSQWRHDLACIEHEVLDRLLAGNTVCHGLGAHLYVRGVSHAMKIRILSANSGETGDIAAGKGGNPDKSKKSRPAKLQERKKWSMAAYGCDETELSRYDLVINLDQIDPDEAVKTITDAAGFRKFQVMTYSMKCLTDLALTARVNTVLLEVMSDVKVEARDGSVVVMTRSSNRNKREKTAKIKELAGGVEGVNLVEVHVKKRI
ncbi:MAG TPA: cytidylate kinase family protein [Desulfobacteraceae bacterium]|nr:cytidylate kinase family protein [Desulfobacteraceae bacterium]